MTTHKEMIQDYKSNLKVWQDYTRTLDPKELEPAGNYLIGAVCTRIKRKDLEDHILVVSEILSERRGRNENSRNA
jgi:hypothetical protein